MVYRKPGSGAQSNYITTRGYQRFVEELDRILTVDRPKITQEVADAAAQGDRSENAEYIYGKKKLREIDRRLRFLSTRMDKLIVVEPTDSGDGKVRFGAWVELEDEDGETVEYRVVGADESDASRGEISLDSPVGRALIGKQDGDEVTVRRPKGAITYTVVGVRYE
jgi:transcription elongation factor GreB